MVTTTKNAPKPAAKPAAAAPAEAAKPKTVDLLDFSTLEVKDVKADEIKHTRPSQLDTTPVLEWLTESYKTDQAKSVNVPSKAAADAMETLLRSGAARLKIGVKILVLPVDKTAKDGVQTVKFLGKPKRPYTPPTK